MKVAIVMSADALILGPLASGYVRTVVDLSTLPRIGEMIVVDAATMTMREVMQIVWTLDGEPPEIRLGAFSDGELDTLAASGWERVE